MGSNEFWQLLSLPKEFIVTIPIEIRDILTVCKLSSSSGFPSQNRFLPCKWGLPQGCRKPFTMQMRFAAITYSTPKVCGNVVANLICMVKVGDNLICMVKVWWKEFAANSPQCLRQTCRNIRQRAFILIRMCYMYFSLVLLFIQLIYYYYFIFYIITIIIFLFFFSFHIFYSVYNETIHTHNSYLFKTQKYIFNISVVTVCHWMLW